MGHTQPTQNNSNCPCALVRGISPLFFGFLAMAMAIRWFVRD
jgi:hypothetical protein